MRAHRLYGSSSLRALLTFAAALALVLAWGPPAAQAQSPQRVGIAVGTAVNLADDEADELAAELGHALEAELGVVATAGAEARRRLPEGGLPEACAADDDCRRDLGHRLDADELLILVIVRVGPRTQIDSTWVDVATGKVASRPAIVLDGDSSPDERFTDAARTLLPHLAPAAEVAPAPSTSPAVGPMRDPAPRRLGTPGWIALGVSGAALIGGASFGFLTMSAYGDCEDSGTCNGSDKDAIRRNGLIADGLTITAVAAGTTALILYLTSGGDDGGEHAARGRPSGLVPWAGAAPGSGQFTFGVGGRF
ncbi:hypothetical protein [Haliangium sp.]|uniref:hypothetical protein n=1 Tax=Haliangium sp. TaxID=2663208 RepID=UPI003D13B3B4